MMRISLPVVLVTILAAVGPAFSQGADTATTGAQSQGSQQAVQVGAGSKGDVTPGSSGPQSEGGEVIQPLPVMFPIRPPADPFYGPAMLPIARHQMRCELIGHVAPKQRCEANAQRRNPGQADD
jgi:hypothetical protein